MTNEKVSSLKYETRISRFSAELEKNIWILLNSRANGKVSRQVNVYGEFIIFSRVITVS